jgi:hypothetical protein
MKDAELPVRAHFAPPDSRRMRERVSMACDGEQLHACTAVQYPWQATFVETVIQAGGSSAGRYSNCPPQERW